MNLSLTIIALSLSSASAGSLRGSHATLFAGGMDRKESPADTRIIGGSEANSGRFPYAISIQDGIGHFCGGSLIAPDMVLTAAHCQGGTYDVVIGRHNLNSNSGESIPMKKETPYPKYNDKTTDGDWMLVLLERPTKQNVPFIKLNSDKNSPSVGEDVTVMGWGDTTSDDYTQELADVLMSVDVNVISNSDCDASEGTINGWSDSYKGQITSNMLCAADRGQDSCQGDSGGPLVIQGKSGDGSDDVQIGVVSWGVGCASPDFPGVYSRISESYDWIVSEVCKQSSAPPADLCGGSSGVTSYVESDDNSNNDDGGRDDAAANDDYDDDFSYDDFSHDNNAVGNNTVGDDYIYDDDSNGEDDSVSIEPAQFNTTDSTEVSTDGNWVTIIEDDFNSDFGMFSSGGGDAKWLSEKKDRTGVLNIQDGNGESSTVYSNAIIDSSYSVYRVVFSAYLLGMEDNDKFCLDISTDGGSSWIEEKCWNINDLDSKVWHDDVVAEFEADNASELVVRFRCQADHNQDDVFIDKVAIQGLQ